MAFKGTKGFSSSFTVKVDKAVVVQIQTDTDKSFPSESPLLASNQPAASLVKASPTVAKSPAPKAHGFKAALEKALAPKADGFVFTKSIATVGAPTLTIDKVAVERALAEIAKSLESPVAPSPVVNDVKIPAGTSLSQAEVSGSSVPRDNQGDGHIASPELLPKTD